MASTKIQNLPIKAPIGSMKIPTGGFGDYSITVNGFAEFIIDAFNIATTNYVDNIVADKEDRILTTGGNLSPVSKLTDVPDTNNDVIDEVAQALLDRIEYVKDNFSTAPSHNELLGRSATGAHPSTSIAHKSGTVYTYLQSNETDINQIKNVDIPSINNSLSDKQDLISTGAALSPVPSLSAVPSLSHIGVNTAVQALLDRTAYYSNHNNLNNRSNPNSHPATAISDGAENQKEINDKNIRVFESLSDLLDYTPRKNGQTVFLKSIHLGLSKGGGHFVFHSGSTKNDGGIFFATATGSWHRVTMEIWHNIEWWGAVGDGVTDDTAAIKSAVLAHKYDELSNKMPRGSFCTIFFPASEGAYIVSDTIYLMPFIRLKGDSAFGGSTTHNHKKYASIIGANFPNSINYAWVISTENYKTNGDALDWNSYYTGVDVDSGNVTPCFGACVEDLWIDNINRFNRIYGGVRFIAAPESTINNCWVTGFDVSVMFTGSWNIRANVSTQAVKCGVALWGDINGCILNGYQHKITDVSPLPEQVAIFEIPISTSCGVYAQYAQYSSANLISEYFGYGVYNQSEVKASIQNLYTEANNIGIHVGTLCSAQIDGISGVSNNYSASTASGATLIVKAVEPNNYLESFFSDLNSRTRYVELPSTVGKFDTTNPAVNVLGYLEKNIVYVDSTIGSDDNHGLTIDFPVQTLNRAMTIASTMPAPNHHKTAFVNKARKSATIHFLDSGIYRPRTHQDVQNMDIIFTSTYGLTPKIVTGGQCFKLIDSTVLVQSSVLLQREYEDNYQPSQGMFICVGVCSVSTRGNMQLEYPLVSVDPSVVADVNIDILGGTGAMTGTARYFQTTSNNVAVRVFVRLNNTGADINSRSDKGVEVPAQTYVVKNISHVLS